jgi:hypothetical protein
VIFRLTIALLLLGLTFSESADAQRNKRSQDAPQATKQGAAQDQRGTEKAPLIVKTLPTEKNETETKADKEKEDERRYNESWLTTYTGLLAWFTAGLIAVGLGQICMFFRQLGYMKQGMIDAKIAAEAAKESADTAKTQAETARGTLVTMQDTAERQLRAYVFIDDAKFEHAPSPPHLWRIILVIKNFGQTPAYDVIARIDRDITARRPDDALIQFSNNATTYPRTTVAPQKWAAIQIPCDQPFCRLAHGEDGWAAATKSGNYAYLWGRIDYVTLGKPRWITFQMQCHFGQITNFGYSLNGNDTDDNR